jgi:hypothetical protein
MQMRTYTSAWCRVNEAVGSCDDEAGTAVASAKSVGRCSPSINYSVPLIFLPRHFECGILSATASGGEETASEIERARDVLIATYRAALRTSDTASSLEKYALRHAVAQSSAAAARQARRLESWTIECASLWSPLKVTSFALLVARRP